MKEVNSNKPKPSNKTLIIVGCLLLASLVGNILAWNAKISAERSFRYWQGENQKQSEKFKPYRDRIDELEQKIAELEAEQ